MEACTQYTTVLLLYAAENTLSSCRIVSKSSLHNAPSAPPQKIQCRAENSQTLALTWEPPPSHHQNGRIQGYKIYFENMMEHPPGHIEADTKMSTDTRIKLHSLQKYSNYSIQAWAFTSAGDGVKSHPMYCYTDEDIPGAPMSIKVVSTSPNSLTVSWLPPIKPNGKITYFCVYWRSLDNGKQKPPDKKKLPHTENHYQIHQLSSSGTYEVWVTASTRVGEGESTHVVFATPAIRGSAVVISFGGPITVQGGDGVTLPCLIFGDPQPIRKWVPRSMPHNIKLLPDGSLFINTAQKMHQRNYTCIAENTHGSDEITYYLRVIVPPDPPVLTVTGRGSNWIDLSWDVKDDGGSAVRGYLLEHAPYSSKMMQWNEERLNRDIHNFKLTSLLCGTKYNLRMFAFNSAGTGEPTKVLTTQTEGGRPIKPLESNFIQGNVSSATLNLKAWNSNGCPIMSFSIEYKDVTHTDWITVGNAIQHMDKFDIIALWPGRKYKIRVQALNSAGTSSAEYIFKTPQNLGVTLSPNSIKISSEDTPFYLEASVMLPLGGIICLIFLSAGVTATLCIRKQREGENGTRTQTQPKDPSHMTLDNKSNLAQREQFYAAVHKGVGSPMHDLQCEQVPEYPDDISPYATFHVAPQQVNTNQHLHNFMYHNHVLTAMETMPLKSGNMKEEYLKGRSALKGNKCISVGSDYSGSTTDQWSEPSRPERVTLNVYSGNNLGGDSSSSPDQSPILERRVPYRHKHIVSGRVTLAKCSRSSDPAYPGTLTRVRRDKPSGIGFSANTLEPPSGFTDVVESNGIDCDRSSIDRLKHRSKGFRSKRERRSQFTIAV